MTDEILRGRTLPCPLAEAETDGCGFTVDLPVPEPEYRPTWRESVRRDLFASEHAESWTAQFREHLRAAHTLDELVEYVAWEPHRIWSELD